MPCLVTRAIFVCQIDQRVLSIWIGMISPGPQVQVMYKLAYESFLNDWRLLLFALTHPQIPI